MSLYFLDVQMNPLGYISFKVFKKGPYH